MRGSAAGLLMKSVLWRPNQQIAGAYLGSAGGGVGGDNDFAKDESEEGGGDAPRGGGVEPEVAGYNGGDALRHARSWVRVSSARSHIAQ